LSKEKKYSVSLREENLNDFNTDGFIDVTEEALNLGIRKNNGYGKDNIGSLGIKGVFVRGWDKQNRIKTILWDGIGRDDVGESVRQDYIDLLNYAAYAIMLIDNTWYDKPKISLDEQVEILKERGYSVIEGPPD